MTAVTVAPLVGVETVTVQAALALPRYRERKKCGFFKETQRGGGDGGQLLFVEGAY